MGAPVMPPALVTRRPWAARIARGRAMCGWGTLAVIVAALAADPAHAGEVQVVSRTLGEGYVVQVPGDGGQLLRRRRLVQMVSLGVYGLLPPPPGQARRDPADGQLRIRTSLRLRHDFGDFQRGASGRAGALVGAVDGRQVDLMFGYLEGERLGGWVDLRLGRQLEASGLDFFAFDGGWIRVRTPVHLAPEVFAGFGVRGGDALGYSEFDLDGLMGLVSEDGPPTRRVVVGAAASILGLRWLQARVAYRRSWSPARLNSEQDLAATTVDQSVLSARVALDPLRGQIVPYGAVRTNLGTARVDDVSAGISWNVTPRHGLRLTYLRRIPSFDLDSIFNVFAISPFDDGRLIYQVRLGRGWTAEARAQVRVLHDQTTASGQGPERRVRPGYGGGAGVVHQRRRLALRLDGFGLGGEGGVRAGGMATSRVHLWWDRIALDSRAFVTYYRDDVMAARRGTNLALQLGANVRLDHGVYLHVVGEELVTPHLRSALRVWGALSVDWTLRAGGR